MTIFHGFGGGLKPANHETFKEFDLILKTATAYTTSITGVKKNKIITINATVGNFPSCCGAGIISGFSYSSYDEKGNFLPGSEIDAASLFECFLGSGGGIGNYFYILAKSYDPSLKWKWSNPLYAELAKKGTLLSKWRNPSHTGRTCDFLYEYRIPNSVATKDSLNLLGDPGE